MKIQHIIYSLIVLLLSLSVKAQHIQSSTKEILDKMEQLQRHNQSAEAIKLLEESI